MNTAWSLLRQPKTENPWLHWHPSEIDACVEARAEHSPPPLDAAELAEVTGAMSRWGADAASLTNTALLAQAGTQVIVAGQQPGLLAGPLYTIYKALGAVALARELQARHPEKQFVPVFWVASEDDDFEEIRSACWPGADGALHDFKMPDVLHSPGQMIGTLPAHGWSDDLAEALRSSTNTTERRDAALELVRAAHEGAGNFEDAFCRLLLAFTKGLGLVAISPLMQWARRRGATVIRREIETAGTSTRLLLERAEKLKAAGYEAPIHRRPDAVNAFWLDERSRRHVIRLAENGFQILSPDPAEPARLLTREALLAELDAHPDRFAYNVVARTTIQDSILPTAAQMVGPGEAGYLVQLEAVYEHYGAFAPVRWPRPRAVLVPQQASRALAKAGVGVEDAIEHDAKELVRRRIEASAASTSLDAIDKLREKQLAEIAELATGLGMNPAVKTSATKLGEAMQKGYATLRERMIQSAEADSTTLRESVERATQSLRPHGEPQERILNPIIPFCASLGTDWAGRLLERLDHDWRAEPKIIPLAELEPQP